MKAIAATTAGQINPALHGSIRTRAEESSEAYSNVKSVLVAARKANPDVRFIYTMRKSSKPNVWKFVVDAEPDPKLVSHVGDEYDVSTLPEMKMAFDGPIADRNPSEDQWGSYLSGYAPIAGADGHAEAIVGVDMSLDQLRREESSLRRSAVNNAALGLLLATILSVLVTGAAGKLIGRLTRAAQRVMNGDLEFSLPLLGPSEIRDFSNTFNEMILGLKESRERLLEGNARDFLTGLYNHMYLHERLDD
jgi:HAMP domain-containing protein